MLWLVLVTVVTGVYVLLFFCRRKRADEGVAAGRTTSGVASTTGSRTGDNSHTGGSSGGTKQRRGDGLLHHRSDGIESIETMQLRKRLLLDSNCNCITISIDTADFDTFIYNHSVISVVSEFDRIAPVVLIMAAASNDPLQDELLSKVLSAMPQVPPHRCLFYDTSIGKISMVRQLAPSLHLEYDRAAYEQMQSFLKRMVLVAVDSRRSSSQADSVLGASPPQHSGKRFTCVDSMADTLFIDWSIGK